MLGAIIRKNGIENKQKRDKSRKQKTSHNDNTRGLRQRFIHGTIIRLDTVHCLKYV